MVPNDSAPIVGASAPDPRTSHALSAAAAMTGSPTGMPVAAAASRVIVPRGSVGGTRPGSVSGSIGATSHFQSPASAQCWRL